MRMPPKRPAPKGGQRPLPAGAYSAAIPGSKANNALKGALRPAPKIIGKEFRSDPRGGPPLVVGKSHVEAKDNRTRAPR